MRLAVPSEVLPNSSGARTASMVMQFTGQTLTHLSQTMQSSISL
jgi:hypothetical protein